MVRANIDGANKATHAFRQREHAALFCYRLAFVVVLVALSTVSTLVRHHHNDSDHDFLLAVLSKDDRETHRRNLAQAIQANQPTEVFFLNSTHLSHLDGFSASWLQTKADFLDMPFNRIQTCEDAAFRAYDKQRRRKMRMTLDWFDMGVEHMSKWWKIQHWQKEEDPITYRSIASAFMAYIANASRFSLGDDPLLKHTLAVIAFQQYENENNPAIGNDLTVLSLAATIESLRRAGFGRVTVGLQTIEDFDRIQDAFLYLLHGFDPNSRHESSQVITQIGHMEVGFALVMPDTTKTDHIEKNLPKGTLLGLRDAFLFSEETELENAKTNAIQSWLGNKQHPSYWKYVYLTEPDTILHTRPNTLAGLKQELDKGTVLLPHRLQPIPHESDVPGSTRTNFFVPNSFKNVVELDPIGNHDACCDEQAGRDSKPGKDPPYENCGKFWYQCGLGPKPRDTHRRLEPYEFIRLIGGTEIVTIAGSEHGRRCIPKKSAVCRPKAQS